MKGRDAVRRFWTDAKEGAWVSVGELRSGGKVQEGDNP